MPETEQAPGCLVRDERVGCGKQKRVKGQKAPKTGVGFSQVLPKEASSGPDGGQNKEQRLSPHRAFGLVKEEQSMEVETPRMNMWRLAARAAQPWSVGAERI